MNSKKYQSEVVADGTTWVARINRQVSSRKSIISKQKEGFSSQVEAENWAQSTLNEFISTQKIANSRQSDHRKQQTEIKRQRSSRRAKKTETLKAEKLESSLDDPPLAKT